MIEWKEYTGSDEQIAEITNSRVEIFLKYTNGVGRFKSSLFVGDWQHPLLTHYLICNPHQLADMICQQARTGQPVWVKKYSNSFGYITTEPDWNIPNAEYSFTPFDD